MTYVTHNQENRIATIGTSLQGYVSVNYATLRELFGKPLDGDGYKVDAEWIIQFDDGTVATIYNYKDGKNYNGEDGTETTEITEWHIGGNNPRSVYLVKELIDDIPVETPVSKPTIEQIVEELAARLSRLEVFTGMVAPAPLPIDDSAPAVTFAAEDSKFELAGWDEPTADEVTRFWSDENADERADVIREARYGKQL